ncbi:MAG: flagellar hook-length control protein FliK [Planctomycetes bacterium]|nr:flagellar hook-length control protein FliK [Planctomycetota bacterium]
MIDGHATTWKAEVSPSATQAAARQSTKEPDSLNGDFVGDSIAGFDAVLSALTASAGVSLEGRKELQPEQMFEPGVDGGRERYMATLRAEDRADRVGGSGEPRYDAGSVQARRATTATPRQDLSSYSPVDSAGLSDSSERSARSAAGRRSDGPLMGLVDSNDASLSSAKRSSEMSSGRVTDPGTSASRSESVGSMNNAGPQPPASPVISAVAEVSPAASAASARSAGQPSGPVAQQVAELLSVGRGGDVESNRAVASASNGDRTNTGDTGKKGSEVVGRRPAGDSANRSPGAARPGERVEFDQLIRAIRLRTGPRYSTARLHLEPPELGRIRVDVRLAGNELQVMVRTETAEARKLLARRAGTLEAALVRAGINVERFEVVVDPVGDRSAGFERAGGEDQAESMSKRDPMPEEYGAVRTGEPGADEPWSVETEEDVDSTVVAEARLDIRV